MNRAATAVPVVLMLVVCGFIPGGGGDMTVQGDTLYVGGSGPGNYSSVQAALDASSDGDTVYVYNDSSPYRERVVVATRVRLTGESRRTTVIDGGGNGTVVAVAASDVVVSGLTVQGSGANGTGRAGVLFSATGCTARDMVLRDNQYGVICRGRAHRVIHTRAAENIGGVHIQGAAACVIEENVLDGNQVSGVSLQDATGNVVSGNHIANGSSSQGILAGGTGNRIEGNVVMGQRYGGLQLLSSGNVVTNNSFIRCGLGAMYSHRSNAVRDNTVNGKPLVYLEGAADVTVADAGQVFLVDCTGVTVSGQRLLNTTVAIELVASAGCHITGNVISGNLEGVMLWNASGNRIAGNTITDNQFEGIDIGPFSHHTRVEGNVISGNNDGISMWSESNLVAGNDINGNWHGIQLDLSDNNTISGNEIADNTEGVSLWQESHSNHISGNDCSDNTRAISLHYGNTGNVISGNKITGSEYGIDVSGTSEGNFLEGNNLSGNDVGVWIGSTGNVIRYNTFMDSKRRHATFVSAERNPLIPRNRWNRNYWGRPHLLPKAILGWRLPFPWINVDWRPLLQPYQG